MEMTNLNEIFGNSGLSYKEAFDLITKGAVTGIYKVYEGFLTEGDPVEYDFETDLSRCALDGFMVNDGVGSISVAFELMEETGYGDNFTLIKDEILDLKGMRIKKIKLTWIANANYRIFVV